MTLENGVCVCVYVVYIYVLFAGQGGSGQPTMVTMPAQLATRQDDTGVRSSFFLLLAVALD